jgi:halogenation protein CepH
MVLIGDAACFVDPIFSSGVHLATYGALLAARSINSVLAQAVDEETAFREFEQRYCREYGVFYEFLVSFYDMHVDENSYFWSAKKVTDSSSTDLESFVTLVGVSSSEEALTDRLKSRSSEFARAVDELVANKEQSVLPLMKSSVVKQAMREGLREQARGLFGQEAETDIPVLEGGLVATTDGLGWAHAV